MKNFTEVLVDDNGVEVLVQYEADVEPEFMAEPNNPSTLVEMSVYTVLTCVEVVIAGEGLDITTQLSEKQKQKIISKLTYPS